jgi:hypothetical protein
MGKPIILIPLSAKYAEKNNLKSYFYTTLMEYEELWRREDIENEEENIFYDIWEFHKRKHWAFKGAMYKYNNIANIFNNAEKNDRDEIIYDYEVEAFTYIMADHKRELAYFLLPFCFDINNLIISFIDYIEEGFLSVIPFIYPKLPNEPRRRQIKTRCPSSLYYKKT